MPATAAPPTRRMNRDEIVRLGEAGRPWEFLAVAAQALRVAPDDAGVRVLAAANFARLGLRTAALEHLSLLEAGAVAAVDQLRAATESLPGDEIPGATAVQTCRANASVLIERGVDLSGGLERWIGANTGTRWFRASGGNVVRVRRRVAAQGRSQATDSGTPELLGDHAGAAQGFVAQHFGAGQPDPEQRPRFNNVYLEGADPPWMLRRIAEVLPRRKDGSWTRLVLVQADAMELLDGLALADLRGVLRQERLSVAVGARALEGWFRERLDSQITGPVVPLNAVRARLTPALEASVRVAEDAQLREYERLTRDVRAKYTGRDRAWWSRRYAAARGADPLRVLVPTCRYSTFVQHASRDLVAALSRAGCRADLLIEPDDTSHFSSLAYARKFAEFEPDLVVLINYTRANLGSLCPPEVPWVCWIQDAMPHQFNPEVGRAQGAMDFLAGHLHPELFERHGFPRERTLAMPVAASEEKFHDGPVEPALARAYECEVALLTHHSETPEAMHARLSREAGPAGLIRRALGALYPRVTAIAADAGAASAQGALLAATRAALGEAGGGDPAPDAVAQVYRHYACPLADRALRHEMLGWAAEVCERRGWRLHLYGRGWESHPRFGRYARGEVEHGEPLRAAYRGARAHLHASVMTLSHQRVMECALSGGLPLCRLTADAMSIVRSCAQRSAAASGITPRREDADRVWYAVADNAELMGLTGLLQRLGMGPPPGGEYESGKRRVASLLSRPALEPEHRPDWLLVDLAETTFGDAAGLERQVEHAMDAPAWRNGMSAAIAGRVRERLTHTAFVARVLDLVRGSLGAPP
ncbi:MAG: hypothetical protein IT437_06265 [Phycisphaerales bacterium]|nr:hypothetical protein [Phycisphaerales bacterium]